MKEPRWPVQGKVRGLTPNQRDPYCPILCRICGRELSPWEDFGQWRIVAWRSSSLYQYTVRAICPAHYEDEEVSP